LKSSTRCLVLGGCGFIGSHLIDALLTRGHHVCCFDRGHTASSGETYRSHSAFEFIEGDFMSESDIVQALTGCEVCFHLVSTTLPKSSNADPVFDVESNVIGSVRLLTHAITAGVRKVIFVSSGGTIYGTPTQLPIPESHPTDPLCSYGISKLAIEKYLGLFHQLYGLDYAVLRIANPFGERQRIQASQGVVAVFLGKILRQEPIEIWGDGEIIRDYIYISDVVNALLAVFEKTTHPHHIFNIGSGRGHSLNEVIDAIEKVTGISANRHYLPARPFDVPKSVLCIERANNILKWAPKIDFERGLEYFFDWVKHTNGSNK
jgi:UDP-glucose 4-epimerase